MRVDEEVGESSVRRMPTGHGLGPIESQNLGAILDTNDSKRPFSKTEKSPIDSSTLRGASSAAQPWVGPSLGEPAWFGSRF